VAQFDVHRSVGRTRDGYPYFVIVQSSVFEAAMTRLVVPLTRHVAGFPDNIARFTIEGRQVAADPLLMFPIPRDKLGECVASLADDDSAARLIAAINQVISTVYG